MNINEKLSIIFKSLNINQTSFAKSLGISVGNISDIMNAKINPSSQSLQKMAEVYHINLNWLLTGDGEMFIKTADAPTKIPIYDIKASAGFGKDGDFAFPPVKGYFELDSTLLSKYKGRVRVIEVEGDSMSPTFIHGQYVVFVENLIQSDGIYIINKNGAILIKRIQFKPAENKMIIISDNPNYEKEIVNTSDYNGYIVIIGKVFFKVSGC